MYLLLFWVIRHLKVNGMSKLLPEKLVVKIGRSGRLSTPVGIFLLSLFEHT